MSVENPRLRLLLGTRWRLTVLVLVVVALGAFAGAGTTYANQPTEVDVQETHQRDVVTTSTTSAEVVRTDALWPRGTVLVDKPVYLLNATPTMNATATTRISGTNDARITHAWRLTIRVARGEETFYSETATLARATHRGTTASTTATLDVPAIRDRVGVVGEKAAAAGVVTATLSLQVTYRTDPGESFGYGGNETYSAPLALEPGAYAVAGDLGGEANHSRDRRVEVAQPRDWGQVTALALLGVVALVLAGGVVVQDPESIDVEAARIDLHRTRYEEWISPGIIPMGISQQFIELESIEDVVDVAIDTSERVVYDRRRNLYAVISENVVYYFSPGGSWMETAFSGMDVPGDGEGDAAGPAFHPDVFGGDGPGSDGDGAGGEVGAPGGEGAFGFGGDLRDGGTEDGPFGESRDQDDPFSESRDQDDPFSESRDQEGSGDGPSDDGGGGTDD